MDLADFRTAFRTRLGLPSTDSFYTDTVVDALVNSALQFVSSEVDWPWLEKSETLTTAASDEDYATASDYMRTIGVFDPTGIPLIRKPIDELEHMSAAEGSVVRFYAIYGSQILLRPVPDGIYSLSHRYVGTEPVLSTGTDEPLMPAQFHDIVVEYAVYLARMRSGNTGEAAANLEVYDRWIAVMKARANRFADSRGGGVAVPTPGAAE